MIDSVYRLNNVNQLNELFIKVAGTSVQLGIIDETDMADLSPIKETFEEIKLPYSRRELALSLYEEYKPYVEKYFRQLQELNYSLFYTSYSAEVEGFKDFSAPFLTLIITSSSDPRISIDTVPPVNLN